MSSLVTVVVDLGYVCVVTIHQLLEVNVASSCPMGLILEFLSVLGYASRFLGLLLM